MIRRLLFVAAFAVACGRSQTDIQRDYARSLSPAPLGDPDAPIPDDVRVLRIRVYADEAHRNMTLGWQVRFFRQVERANHVLAQQLRVRLEIESAKPWPRDAALSSLTAALYDLERFDSSEDVDLVVGLTSALPAVTAAVHQLGMARVLGRHIVLRGTDDAEEYAALSRALGKLDTDEWERVYQRRRKHKASVLLLHEIGHVLGAIHVRDSRYFLHPTIERGATMFAPENAALMSAALEAWGPGPRDGETNEKMRVAMLEAVRESKSPVFVAAARARTISMLSSAQALARSTDTEVTEKPPGDTGGAGLDPSHVPPPPDPVAEARSLVGKDDAEAAWAILEPALASAPDDPLTLLVACDVAVRRAPKDDATVTLCRHSAKLSEDPLPLLHLAFVHGERGERKAAVEALVAAEARFDEDGDPERWLYLAQMYRSASAVTRAQSAAERAGDLEGANEVRAWVKKIRAEYGLDASTQLEPLDEVAYVTGRTAIAQAVADGRHADADKAAAELSAAYPKLPSPDADLCEMYAQARRFAEADRACRRALKRDDRSARTHAVMGFVSFGKGRIASAVRHLRRAIALDPDRKDAWTLLAAAYRATGQGARRAALAKRYEARFNAPLR